MRRSHFYRVTFLTLLLKWSTVTDPGTHRDTKICNRFEEVGSFSSRWSDVVSRALWMGCLASLWCLKLKWLQKTRGRQCIMIELLLPKIRFPGFGLAFLNAWYFNTTTWYFNITIMEAIRRQMWELPLSYYGNLNVWDNVILFRNGSYKASLSLSCYIKLMSSVKKKKQKVSFWGKQYTTVERAWALQSYFGLILSLSLISWVTLGNLSWTSHGEQDNS